MSSAGRQVLDNCLRRHHGTQVEDVEGPMGKVPQVVARKRIITAPRTRLQHLGDSEVLLEKKRRSDPPDFPGTTLRNGHVPPG